MRINREISLWCQWWLFWNDTPRAWLCGSETASTQKQGIVPSSFFLLLISYIRGWRFRSFSVACFSHCFAFASYLRFSSIAFTLGQDFSFPFSSRRIMWPILEQSSLWDTLRYFCLSYFFDTSWCRLSWSTANPTFSLQLYPASYIATELVPRTLFRI